MRIGQMDVDDVLFELYERVQRLESPQAGRLIDDEGLTYAPSCECGCRERVFAQVTLPDCDPGEVFERWICASCDLPWLFNRGEIAVHEVQVPQACGLEHERGEIERLAQALKRLSSWESRLYLQLYLWEDTRSRTEIARIANRRWRRGPFGSWTEWHVRQTIAGAQRKIFNELGLKSRTRRRETMQLRDHLRRRQPEKL